MVRKLRGASVRKTAASTPGKKSPAANLQVSLPTKPNQPSDNLQDYSIFLFGAKGVGKSSLAGQFPNALLFQWEPFRTNLPVMQVPAKDEPPLNWERQKAYITLITKEKKPGQITPVIDTVDRAWDACIASICGARCHPGFINDYGATWDKIKREFDYQFTRLLAHRIKPIFISHARLRDVNPPLGEQYQQYIPTLQPSCWDNIIKAICDICLYYGFYGQDRVIVVRGGEFVWTACNLDDHFRTPDGEPIAMFLAGESAAEAYKRLQQAWNNKISRDLVWTVSEYMAVQEEAKQSHKR